MTGTDTSPVVVADNLSLTFLSATGDVEALKNVSLNISQGEFVSLIGPSGCGKTTLLRCIADIEKATAGSLKIFDKDPTQARKDRMYGYVFQAPVLFPWRTVQKNVELPHEIFNTDKDKLAKIIEESLALVGLTDFKDKYPWQLSGGMQQRVSIARALSFNPQLLLMDEPFGALDEITRNNLNLELLKIWQQTNNTIVFVTHSIPEAVFLSTRIVVMSPRPGRIVDIIEVDLPKERSMELYDSPDFAKIANKVRHSLNH